MTFRP